MIMIMICTYIDLGRPKVYILAQSLGRPRKTPLSHTFRRGGTVMADSPPKWIIFRAIIQHVIRADISVTKLE